MPWNSQQASRPESHFVRQFDRQVERVVGAIPLGMVLTYGLVSKLAGFPKHSRQVGRVLGNQPEGSCLPWHRVVNSQGRIRTSPPQEQLARLQSEGVLVENLRVNLKRHLWSPHPLAFCEEM